MRKLPGRLYAAIGAVILIVVIAVIWINAGTGSKPKDAASKTVSKVSEESVQATGQKSEADAEALKLGAIAVPNYDQVGAQPLDANFSSALQNFSWNSAAKVLTKDSSGSNQVYSPISLYMALALTADGARGNTQTEMLKALAMNDLGISKVSDQTHRLFNDLYFDNQIGRLKFANSLWLNKEVGFNQAFLSQVAENDYASSYSVDFKAEDTESRINQWIADNTGGKLGTDNGRLEIDPNTVMDIINTTYFYDEWLDIILARDTKEDKFYPDDGSTVNVPFMNTKISGYLAKGDGYTASSLDFKNEERMIFILPDKGTSPYDLLKNPSLLSAVATPNSGESGDVIFKIPKFKFYNKMELSNMLKGMGIQTAFQPDQADFGNFSAFKPLSISGVLQSAYISIDEKGCEAAAYTAVVLSGGAARPKDTFEMTLDRPFIFAITKEVYSIGNSSPQQVPLFIGVVNNPAR